MSCGTYNFGLIIRTPYPSSEPKIYPGSPRERVRSVRNLIQHEIPTPNRGPMAPGVLHAGIRLFPFAPFWVVRIRPFSFAPSAASGDASGRNGCATLADNAWADDVEKQHTFQINHTQPSSITRQLRLPLWKLTFRNTFSHPHLTMPRKTKAKKSYSPLDFLRSSPTSSRSRGPERDSPSSPRQVRGGGSVRGRIHKEHNTKVGSQRGRGRETPAARRRMDQEAVKGTSMMRGAWSCLLYTSPSPRDS